MKLIKTGARFLYNSSAYSIGDKIIGTDKSEYKGLFGTITEIRDGEDKETENDTPDIYCTFDPPVNPYDIKRLESRFSNLYLEPKKLEDIIFDNVIMAPEMIEPLSSGSLKLTVYTVLEDWSVNNSNGYSAALFTDFKDAKLYMHNKLSDEMETGCIYEWCENSGFLKESSENFYKCWIDGEYSTYHYSIYIKTEELQLSNQAIGLIGRTCIDECRMEDFITYLEKDSKFNVLSDKRQFIDNGIPKLIEKKLGMNDQYMECYWDSISETANDILYKINNC